MNRPPRVFVIVVNWNGWEDTLKCLRSLAAIDYSCYHVIIVDNGSTDDSVPRLRRGIRDLGMKLTLIVNDKNLGFGGGNNTGMRYVLDSLQADGRRLVSSTYLLLLNNDTVVEPHFLTCLIKVGESNERIGILGPKIYFHDEPNRVFFGGGKLNQTYTGGTHLEYGTVEDTSRLQPSCAWQTVDYITGCCLLIKVSVVREIGLMYEPYFLYFEDADWNLRAHQEGYISALVPAAKIWHKVSRTTKVGSFTYIYYLARNGLLLARRNAPLATKFIAYGRGILVLVKQIVRLVLNRPNAVHSRATIKGVKDFFMNRSGKLHEHRW